MIMILIAISDFDDDIVQMEDGSYAQMVEGHEMVQPGQQMLVQVRHFYFQIKFWIKILRKYLFP